jgi:endonuclease-8
MAQLSRRGARAATPGSWESAGSPLEREVAFSCEKALDERPFALKTLLVPEGDTLFRTATTLHAALAGRALTEVRAAVPQVAYGALQGLVVTRVVAHGKHLYIHFADGRALRTHLRMTGSFHVYRPGERWQKPARLVRYVLANAEYEVVCFAAPDIELLRAGEAEEHTSRLGPDVLAPEFDVAEAARRLTALGSLSIAEALLAQRAVAGLGNVYKSELLFVRRTSPFAPVAELAPERLLALLTTARKLMLVNRDGGRRRTRGGAEPLWVYGRAGAPCLVCGDAIVMQRQGADARSTYFCRRCQSVD